MKEERLFNKVRKLSKKWWFYLVLFIIFFIPSIATKGLDPRNTSDFVVTVFKHSFANSISPIYPVIQSVIIVCIALLLIFKSRVTRVFSIMVATNYSLIAVVDNVAITEKYGLGIILGNIVAFSIISLLWFWEAFINKNTFNRKNKSIPVYIFIVLASFSFLLPADANTLLPSINILTLFTSGSGVWFCFVTPLYLSLLLYFYPSINIVILRVMSFIGLIIGLFNLSTHFITYVKTNWWLGVLHLPLFIISLYSLIISLKHRDSQG
jgi:hypothetical protein